MNSPSARRECSSTEPDPVVRALLAEGARRLHSAGVDSPRLTAELLLSHILQCDRAALFARAGDTVPPDPARAFLDLIARRVARQPLQHILGSTEFWTLTLRTDPRALIPRPETEHLIQSALDHLAGQREHSSPSHRLVLRQSGSGVSPLHPPSQAAPSSSPGVAQPPPAASVASSGVAQPPPAVSVSVPEPRTPPPEPPPSHIADIGTGTGCIPIALALELPGAQFVASDLSPDALSLAAENARLHCVDDRIRFLRGDLVAPYLEAGLAGCFDLVLSNPPYIPSSDLPALQPEVRDHDPRTALDGGPDGLHILRRLLRETPALLRPGGALIVEVGAGQAQPLAAEAGQTGWRVLRIVRDLQSIERVLVMTRADATPAS